MTGRQRPRDPPPVPGQLLDWNDSRHWDYERELPCRYCGKPTRLRDSKRSPSHKTCAEAAIAQQAADAADAYHNEGHLG